MSDGQAILKRVLTVKTKVTEAFCERTNKELKDELELLEAQGQQLESQFQQAMQQLDSLAAQGQNVQKQLLDLNQEVLQRRTQLNSLKIQISGRLAKLAQAKVGDYVITGTLDQFVTIKPGDNLYEKLNRAELIVEDGIVQEIRTTAVTSASDQDAAAPAKRSASAKAGKGSAQPVPL